MKKMQPLDVEFKDGSIRAISIEQYIIFVENNQQKQRFKRDAFLWTPCIYFSSSSNENKKKSLISLVKNFFVLMQKQQKHFVRF